MGRYTVHLVGESNYQDVISHLAAGGTAKLVPDPMNEHDPRAIKAITSSGETIGYVEKEGWLTRAMLDDLTPVASRVLEIVGGDAAKPSRGVVLEVLTGPEAIAALDQSAVAAAGLPAGSSGITRMPTWAIVALVLVGIVIVAIISAAPAPSSKPVAATVTKPPSIAAPDGVPSASTASASGTLASASVDEPESAAAVGLAGPQANAARSAQQYLGMTGFSRKGLIQQLSSDAGSGYDVADATIAVDSLSVDWNEQAARSAEQYIGMTGFSCRGLIEQLSSDAGSGYTKSQATYGAEKAGAC